MNINGDYKNMHYHDPVLESDRLQSGFSLIEIMVALTLSLFLIVGMIQLLIGNKQSYRVHEAQSRIQENGRFALEVFSHDMRMADFTGCPSGKEIDNVLNNPTDWWKNLGSNAVIGYDGTQVFPGKSFGTGSGDRINGTDAIIIIKGSDPNYSIVKHDKNLAEFTLNGLPKIKKGSIMMGCNPADYYTQVSVFQLKDVNVNGATTVVSHGVGVVSPGNSSSTLGQIYGTSSIMIDFVPVAYYIGVSTSGSSRSLYQMRLTVTDAGVASMEANELVEGVENMQIVYGQDSGTDKIIDPPYRDASDVSKWSDVLSVRVNLLMTSLEDKLSTALQTVTFPADTGNANTGGNVYTPVSTDRRLRQTFSTTVGIRNRLPLL